MFATIPIKAVNITIAVNFLSQLAYQRIYACYQSKVLLLSDFYIL